jgi:RNA-directed DNA polymerase
MEHPGTWEIQYIPHREVETDNVKSGEGNDGVLEVGLTHSRGVVGVTPGDFRLRLKRLEGVSDQSETDRDTPCAHRSAEWVETRLCVISEMARQDPRCKFKNIAYLLNADYLAQCFWELKPKAAPGIDGVTWRKYRKELDGNLSDLVKRMKANQYRPQAVKRVYIPKDNKSKRPLGVPAIEDKAVQMGMAKILESIFERDFLDVSYGFRPGRSCHQALVALDKMIMTRPVNYVLDADIKGFFDNVDHKKLVSCLQARVTDPQFLRLVARFLKSGVLEDGARIEVDKGTPQGGVLSPILSNIFLHHALDIWFENKLKGKLRGYAGLIRYADDFVICVQHKDDAQIILGELEARLAKCGLTLSKDKTRLLEFGRNAIQQARQRGERPGTFDFLGFTHFCDTTRRGGFKVGRKTSGKKFRQKVKAINHWLRSIRNYVPLKEWWGILQRKLAGHYGYYGISGNSHGIRDFYLVVVRMALKWLNRRSQRRSFNWETYSSYLTRYPLPLPRIQHNLYTLWPAR